MKGKFTIEKTPFSSTKYYSGEYTCDCSQWEDEIQTETFEFTVVVTEDHENGLEEIMEITWVTQAPPNVGEAEDWINANFFNKIVE